MKTITNIRLYNCTEAARILHVASSTVMRWGKDWRVVPYAENISRPLFTMDAILQAKEELDRGLDRPTIKHPELRRKNLHMLQDRWIPTKALKAKMKAVIEADKEVAKEQMRKTAEELLKASEKMTN